MDKTITVSNSALAVKMIKLLFFLSLSYLQQYNTKYYYKLGNVTVREFFFFTPPEPGLDVPYIFGLIGKLSRLLS
jgi:hypothetical protein